MYTNTAKDIVNELLEAEDPDFDADEYMAPIPDPIGQGLQQMGYTGVSADRHKYWDKTLLDTPRGGRCIITFGNVTDPSWNGLEESGVMYISIDRLVALVGWVNLWEATIQKDKVLQAAPALESGAKTAIDMDMDGVDFKAGMRALLSYYR
jgi:hypothetical protein